jgi:hypothetical protein
MVATQQEYDRLPIGARFRHPDGYTYRKEKHSHEVPEGPQKMATGGEVQPEQPEIPDQGATEPPQPPQPPGDTDTVPAMLTPGEYVVSKPAVDQLGAQHLQELEQLLVTERMMDQPPSGATTSTSPTMPSSIPTSTAPIPTGKGEGVLAKWGPVFEQLAPKYGLDPDILKAIALQENVNPKYNNPLGRSDDSGVHHYSEDQAQAQIESQIKLLTNPHGPYADFVKTGNIYDLAKVYSPVGAKNDVYGTNASEPSGIIAGLARLKKGTLAQTGG